MTVDLTAAAAADIDAIMAVMDVAFDPGFGEAWSAAQVLGSLATGTAWARIAWSRGAPQGFTVCRQLGPEAELLLIGVVPAARRGGVGRALLETALTDSARRGVSALFLEVRAGNVAAAALYAALGFSRIGQRPNYYRGPDGSRFDAVTLRALVMA